MVNRDQCLLALDQGKLSSFDDGDEEDFEYIWHNLKYFSCFSWLVRIVLHITETYIAHYCLYCDTIT